MKAQPAHRHVLGLDVILLWAAASVMFYHLGFWLFARSASYWLLLQFSLIFAHSGGWTYALAYGLTDSRDWRSLDLSLVHHGCFFAFGAMLHRFASGKATPILKIAAGFLACGCLIEIALLNGLRAFQTGVAMNPMVPQVASSAAVVLMIASMAYNDRIAQVCGSAVGGWIRFGGMLTYPLYLCHAPVGFAVIEGLHDLGVPSMAAWTGGVAIVGLVAASVTAGMEPLVRSASRIIDQLAQMSPTRASTAQRRAEAA